jgi:hypothetical protein
VLEAQVAFAPLQKAQRTVLVMMVKSSDIEKEQGGRSGGEVFAQKRDLPLAYGLFRGFESEFGKNKKASLEKIC